VAADSAYGDQDGFRSELAEAGLPFVMALKPRRGTWAYGADAHTPVDAARDLAWGGPDDPGGWRPVTRAFRDGHTETWWAADATLGWWGPDGVRRLVVATADPGTLPGKATWYLVTNLPRPGGPEVADSPHPPADLAEIVRIYGIRHWIEQSYKQVKDRPAAALARTNPASTSVSNAASSSGPVTARASRRSRTTARLTRILLRLHRSGKAIGQGDKLSGNPKSAHIRGSGRNTEEPQVLVLRRPPRPTGTQRLFITGNRPGLPGRPRPGGAGPIAVGPRRGVRAGLQRRWAETAPVDETVIDGVPLVWVKVTELEALVASWSAYSVPTNVTAEVGADYVIAAGTVRTIDCVAGVVPCRLEAVSVMV
jgi:hypothetical protein